MCTAESQIRTKLLLVHIFIQQSVYTFKQPQAINPYQTGLYRFQCNLNATAYTLLLCFDKNSPLCVLSQGVNKLTLYGIHHIEMSSTRHDIFTVYMSTTPR